MNSINVTVGAFLANIESNVFQKGPQGRPGCNMSWIWPTRLYVFLIFWPPGFGSPSVLNSKIVIFETLTVLSPRIFGFLGDFFGDFPIGGRSPSGFWPTRLYVFLIFWPPGFDSPSVLSWKSCFSGCFEAACNWFAQRGATSCGATWGAVSFWAYRFQHGRGWILQPPS